MASRCGRSCSTATASITTCPKKYAIIHHDRFLAGSTHTIPNLSTPTCATRGAMTPRGFCNTHFVDRFDFDFRARLRCLVAISDSLLVRKETVDFFSHTNLRWPLGDRVFYLFAKKRL